MVPNWDFELYSSCPTYLHQLDNCSSWFNPSNASPDYFNACANASTFVSVPDNIMGYQFARSGSGYAGIIIYSVPSPNFREYIEIQLNDSLIAGNCYHFEMYCSAGENVMYNSDNLGVYFSDTMYTSFLFTTLLLTPQLVNTPGNFPDTSGWTLVAGDYTASGGEKYMMIGNYNDDATTNHPVINPNVGPGYASAYCYIEDVSLCPCGGPCTTGLESVITNPQSAITISPNPFSDKIIITNKNNEEGEILLYDIASRKLLQQQFTNSTSLNTEQLAKGIYIYEVRNKNGVIKKGKVVKE